ncbi:unnamed protein product, partial [Ixodes pacificus]
MAARTAPREGGRGGCEQGQGSAHCAELILELAGATPSLAVAKRVRPEQRRRRSHHEPPGPEGGVRSRLTAGFPSRGRAKAPEGPLGGRPRGARRMDRRRGRDASLLPA